MSWNLLCEGQIGSVSVSELCGENYSAARCLKLSLLTVSVYGYNETSWFNRLYTTISYSMGIV